LIDLKIKETGRRRRSEEEEGPGHRTKVTGQKTADLKKI
jgi:hypothetical protein